MERSLESAAILVAKIKKNNFSHVLKKMKTYKINTCQNNLGIPTIPII